MLAYLRLQQSKLDLHNIRADEGDVLAASHALKQDIAFYEERKNELARNAVKRRQLMGAARDLGAALDPQSIQEKLLSIAGALFPGRRVHLAYGQDFDAYDSHVLAKRQPLLVPSEGFKGNPLIAAPVIMQKSVIGVLRVGGDAGALYSREDLRVLDILSGLASMALDNAVLFGQVQETALRDGLTGLLTHRAFQNHLDAAILEASRYGQPLSVILSDVDHFKKVNDTYGHQAGDQILQGFAHVLDRNVRDVDIVARYGGEEFIILLIQTDHAQAMETAERIRADLAAQEFELTGKNISITSSFGVSTFPQDATSAQQLVRQADQRLYRAKEAGRNRVKGR